MYTMDSIRHLPTHFRTPAKLPLTVDKVHFNRVVSQDSQVMVLNQNWEVPVAQPNQGEWVTLQCKLQGTKLSIYDATSDAQRRTCLVDHSFPLKEPIHPPGQQFQLPKFAQKCSWATGTLGKIGRTVAHWISTML
jgi:hypothetical protein